MTHTASGAGNGQMIHLIVIIAALSMDGFPFGHLGDLAELPAQTPTAQDWAAVGMSPPRNPAKRRDTKDTPEAMRRRREQLKEAQRRRREREKERCDRHLEEARDMRGQITSLRAGVSDLRRRVAEKTSTASNYWHEKTSTASNYSFFSISDFP